jgi:transposase
MTQKAVAQILHVPKSTLSDMLHRTIKRIRNGHRIRGLKSIGIDEIAYSKGHKYATIVYDLARSCVVWVGNGKGRKTIDIFFNTILSPYQKNQIEWASCDMSRAYIGAIEDHCTNAKLVLDRFHIVKALNTAVDEVRKEQWRKATTDIRKTLKGLRWLLFKHSSNRSKKDTRILNSLRKGNRRIHLYLFSPVQAPWKNVNALSSAIFLRTRSPVCGGFLRVLPNRRAGKSPHAERYHLCRHTTRHRPVC